MKINYGYLLLLIIQVSLFAQLYSSTSTNKRNPYQISLRINSDSSVNYCYAQSGNTCYGDHIGSIKRINDTLFHVSAIMIVGQFYMKSIYRDALCIVTDSLMARVIKKYTVQLANGQSHILNAYTTSWPGYYRIDWPYDIHQYNKKEGFNKLFVTIGVKKSITGNPVVFEIPYGSAASFTRGRKEAFDVVIKNGELWMKEEGKITGRFKLSLDL